MRLIIPEATTWSSFALSLTYWRVFSVKYPFLRLTQHNPKVVYACVNLGEAYAPGEIENRSVSINRDIGDALKKLKRTR